MEGKIKRLRDGEVYAYPITVGEAVYVGPDKTLKEKLEPLSIGPSTYLIDLRKWGITEGLPSKPYQDIDYYRSDANIKGINAALKYAYDKEMSDVVLPRGEYAICYPNSIVMQSNITLNLNGSMLRVIYDSNVRSPLDTGNDKTWLFGGNSIDFRNVHNAHVKNGKIIGDMYDRNFADPREVAVEHTYGISFSESSHFCSVSQCEVAAYAGDPINFISRGTVSVSIENGRTLASLDETTGQVIASDNTVITALVDIPSEFRGRHFNLRGLGYSRTTGLNNKKYDAFFYKDDDTFLGVSLNQHVHTMTRIPFGAGKIRLKLVDDNDPTRTLNTLIDFGSFPYNNTVEFNEIYDGHRGGITLGGHYNIIQNNIIRENGKFSNTFIDGTKTFNDPTRYAINQEDSFGHNCIIRNNYITGGFHGILITGWSTFIQDNIITNMQSGFGIILYSMQYANIGGNYMDGAGIYFSGSSTNTAPCVVQILGNYISGHLNIDNGYYETTCKNNHIIHSGEISLGDTTFFEDNIVFIGSNYNAMGISKIPTRNNHYKSFDGAIRELTIRGGEILESTFSGLKLNFNNTGIGSGVTYKNCKFENCELRNQLARKHTFIMENCSFTDTFITTYTLNTPEEIQLDYLIKDSLFESTNKTEFFYIYSNRNNTVKVRIENSTFKINTSTLTRIFNKMYARAALNLEFITNNINYTGTGVHSIEISEDSGLQSSYITYAGLKNVIVKKLTGEKHKTYDPLTMSIEEPTSGYHFLGKITKHGSPQPGGYLGWVCTAEGYAVSNLWAGFSDYLAGDKITDSGFVFQALDSGKTTKNQPTFPTALSSTVLDKTGLGTWADSQTVTVGQYVLPTKENGYFYECTKGGTTDSEEPIWAPVSGNTLTDGTVVWTARKIITWKNIGTKAIFKPYGLISE